MTANYNLDSRLGYDNLINSSRAVRKISLITIVGTWIVVLLLHRLSIGGTWDPVSPTTWGWAILWIAALALGYGLAAEISSSSNPTLAPGLRGARLNGWLKFYCLVVVAGVLLFIFDFAILRGYGFFNTAAGIRDEEVNAVVTGGASSSAISGIGRLLIPAILPLVVLMVKFWSCAFRQTKIFFALTFLILMLQQLFFEGGRFLIASIAVSGLFTFFVMRSITTRNSPTKRRIPIIRLAVLSILILWFFSYVFVSRIAERGDFFSTAYLASVKSYNLTASYDQMYLFEGPFGSLWYSLCMLWLYATQGINELDLILRQPYLEHAYGLYQFPHLAQSIFLLTGIDLRYDALANLPTYGSYATFYGHSFVDFGNTGSIVEAAALGYLTGRGILQMTKGRNSPLSLAAPILFTICLFSAIVSLVPTIWSGLFWAALAGFFLRGYDVYR